MNIKRTLLVLLLLLIQTQLAHAQAPPVQEMLEEFIREHTNEQPLTIVYGTSGNYYDFLAATIMSSSLAGMIHPGYVTYPKVISDNEATIQGNIIIIGGPCANTISETLLEETGYNCADWKFNAGESFAKTVEKENIKALIIAGTDEKDSLRASRALKHFRTSTSINGLSEVSYQRAMTIREAYDLIADENKRKDNLIIVTGTKQDFIPGLTLAEHIAKDEQNTLFPKVEDVEKIGTVTHNNLITIGGPCVNHMTEKLTDERGYNCKDWGLEDGEALIKVVENGEKIAILIAGTTAADTLHAIELIKKKDARLEHADEILLDMNTPLHQINFNQTLTIITSNSPAEKENIALLQHALVTFNTTIDIIDQAQSAPNKGIILALGGPCSNSYSESITKKKGWNCDDWKLKEGESVIKTIGKSIILIAGTTENDTRAAINELLNVQKDNRRLSETILAKDGIQEIKTTPKCTGFICRFVEAYTQNIGERSEEINYETYIESALKGSACLHCFLEHQSRNYVFEIIRTLQGRTTNDAFEEAEKRYLIGKATENIDLMCSAIEHYQKFLETNKLTPEDQLVVYENLLFVSNDCLSERQQHYYLTKILSLVEETGTHWKKNIYTHLLDPGELSITVEKVEIKRSLNVPKNPTKIILGESYIEVTKNDVIGTQIERVVRDWFSLNIDRFPNTPPSFKEELGTYDINYMEGNILRRIVNASGSKVVSLPNMLVVGRQEMKGMIWYSPDETGVFRFEVLPDKVQYPTTKCIKNVCLLEDTHGISSIAALAAQKNVDLALGCGDYYGKVEAAYYLAQKGINSLYPTDRFAAEMIGYTGEGIALGSAPVKQVGDKAIVGNQSVTIKVDEPIVVQTTYTEYPAQYYDAPERYFLKLEELTKIDLNLISVDTPDVKQTYKVIEKARVIGAKVVAIRVGYDEDYPAVQAWLAESKEHRAILFHSSAYTAGFKILEEFPEQTSFGDPRPRIV